MIFLSLACKAMDTGGFYKITKLYSWNSYTNGSVLIQLDNSNSACPGGYWFQDAANSAPKNLLAVALSAYHAKTPVMVYADETSSFNGLGVKTCEIKLIVLGG
jgi:hypothetical protein